MNSPVEIKPEPFRKRDRGTGGDDASEPETVAPESVLSPFTVVRTKRSKKGTVVLPRGPVTCSGHSFSLIACTRPSGPHVRNNGQRVGVCRSQPIDRAWPKGSATQLSVVPSAPCYPRLLISPADASPALRRVTATLCTHLSCFELDLKPRR